MADTVDELQIKINAEATKANDAIDRLVGKLDRLTTSLSRVNGTNLNGLANGVQRLGNAMQVMNTIKTADFTRLATNLTKLGSVNVSALNSAASSMSHLTRAFNSLGTVSANAQAVGEMAKNIAKLGNKSVQTAITNIPQLATAMNNLMATLSRSPQVSQNVIQMTNALANLANQGSRVGTASNSIVKGLNKTSASARTAKKSFGGLASAIGKFYATYFMVIRGLKGLWNSIESTADYTEAFNYYIVSFGKIASKWDSEWENYADENARNYANSFVKTMNETFKKLSGVSFDPQIGLISETGLKNLGLNLQEVTQYAAQLASMMDAVGQSGETTLATTNAFVKLAGDISSLYNIDYSEAANKLRSVLQGQSRAGYGFGWDTTMASLQATADKLNLSKAVNEMSQMEKQQLRILTILQQSRVAWGDQSNTINTLANQIRIFKNNIKEAAMTLGQLFVPILAKIMPIINGITIAIKNLMTSIAGFFGIKIEDIGQGYSDIGDNIGDISDSLDDVAKSAKKANAGLRAFDELKTINMPDASGSGTGGIGGIDLTDKILQATEEYEKAWQEAFNKMESKAQEFANKFEKIFEPIKKLFKDISIGDWFAVGGDVSSIVSGIFNTFSDAIAKVNWRKIGINIGKFISGIDWTKILKSVGKFVWEAINGSMEQWSGMFAAAPIETTILSILALPALVGFGSKIIALIASPFTKVANLITPIISSLGTIIGGLSAPVLAVVAAVTALVSGLGYVFVTNEEVRKSFDSAISSIRDGLQPILEFFTGTLLPDLQSGWGRILEILEPLGEFLEGTFTSIWQDIINPALTYIGQTVLPKVAESFENLWNNALVPLGSFLADVLEPVIQTVSDVLTTLWQNVVVPLADAIGNVLGKAFEGLCDIFNETVVPIANTVIEVFQYLWDNVFSPITDFLWDVFEPVFDDVFEGIGKIIEGLQQTFSGLIDFVTGVFTGDWEQAWEGVKSIFSGIWETLKATLTIPLNAVIGIFEGLANKVIDAWNAIKSVINSIQIEIPSWVPGIGGEKFGFNLEMTGHLNIPRFATGGFPEDGLFMANHNELVGQFSNGKTAVANNEQITDGIKQGVREAVAEVLVPYLSDIAQNTRETANKEFGITQNEVGKAARNYARDYTTRTGRPAYSF